MSPRAAVTSVLRQYATFRGRARRSEYWWFTLFNLALSGVLAVLDKVLFDTPLSQMGLLRGIAALALLVPGIAVVVRRLHDTDRRGWWYLIGFIPIVGTIILLVFMCQDSRPGADRFGPPVKELSTAPTGYGPGF